MGKGAFILRVASLNVRGVNEEGKRVEVGKMCQDRKIDLVGLTETKLKGKGEINFGKFKGMYAGVSERVRARKGVAIVMREELWKCVRQSGSIGSRVIWVKLKLRNESWVFVCAYAPVSGGKEEEKDRFWNELGNCLDCFSESDKICLIGDLNARVGNERREGVVGPYGVDGVNDNGKKLVHLCFNKSLMIGNTWYKKKIDP